METPSSCQVQQQDGSYRSGNVADTVARENPVITYQEDDTFSESLWMLFNDNKTSKGSH